MIVCPLKDLSRYAAVIPGLEEALRVIDGITSLEPATYPLSCGKVMVQQGTTQPAEGRLLEAHRKFLDIQYVVKGEEVVGWAPVDTLTLDGNFNEEKDAGMYDGACDYLRIAAGYCYVVFPEDAHKPCSHLTAPTEFTKMVVKLKV